MKKNLSLTEQKNIESLAINTANVTDYGRDGFTKNGHLKEGFYQLKDKRVIKLSDILSENPQATPEDTTFDFSIIEAAEKYKERLHNFKGFGLDKATKKARPGFYVCSTGEVISLKQLKELRKVLEQDNIKGKDVVDPQHVSSD